MSRRAIKRYEEVEALENAVDKENAGNGAHISDEEQEQTYKPRSVQTTSLFALLGEEEEDADEEDSASDSAPKSPVDEPANGADEGAGDSTEKGNALKGTEEESELQCDGEATKKKKKKNRRRRKRNVPNQEMDRDWIALNEFDDEIKKDEESIVPGWIPSSYFSAEDGDEVRSEASKIMAIIESMVLPSQGEEAVAGEAAVLAESMKLLTVEPRLLNADSELKRLFGSRVVDSERRVEESTARRRGRGGGRAHLRKKISLVSPRDTWFSEAPGLNMVLDSEATNAAGGIKYFRYAHESSYALIQDQYRMLVSTHDPNMLVELSSRYPFHVDTLLQLAEIYRQMGELDRASEQIERCLYVLENSWNIAFKPFDGNCRLRFDVIENRSLYVALFRYSQLLTRRGLHRTALEISKLLLNFDPESDPMGMLMLTDSFALLSKEYNWVQRMHAEYRFIPVQYFPNFAASSAIAAECLKEEASAPSKRGGSKSKKVEKSEVDRDGHGQDVQSADDIFIDALLTFPMLLRPLLAAVQDESTVWAEHRLFDDAWYGAGYEDGGVLTRISRVYAERSKTLWNSSTNKSMLIRCARTAGSLDTAAGMGIDPRTGRSTSAFVKDPARSPRVARCRALRAEAGEWLRTSGLYHSVQIADFSDSTTNLPAELLAGAGADQAVGARAPRTVTMAQGAMEFLQSLLPWREARDAEESM